MSLYTYKTTILSRMMNEKRGNFMAETQEPRNELGQTYDEWIVSQRQFINNQYGDKNIEPWDIIIGMDSQRGVEGIKFSDIGVIVGRVTRPIAPVMSGYSQQAMAQYGATFQGVSYGTKSFQIPITIKASSKEEYNSKVRALVNVIIMPDNQHETSIVFGEEPDIVYYGHFESIPDPQPLTDTSWDYGTTLTFVASDPRGFFNQESEVVDMSSGEIVLTPKGTAYSDPIITITPKENAEPLTQFGYTINSNERVTAGLSTNTLKKFDTKPAVFIDEMNDMGNWQQMQPSLSDPGSVLGFKLGRSDTLSDGKIDVNPSVRGAVTNAIDGTKKADWTSHPEKINIGQFLGPVAISKTNMASTIGKNGNWEASFKLHNIKRYSRALEGIEMYLLDEDGNRRARFGLRSNGNGERAYAWFRFGQDFDDETVAVQTGLGTQHDDLGLDSDFVNKHDVSVPVWNGANISPAFNTHKRTTEYHLTIHSDAIRTLERWWTITETTNYDPQTRKYKTDISYSTLKSAYTQNAKNAILSNKLIKSSCNDFRYIPNWEDQLKLTPARIDYWRKGENKRANDYYKYGPIRGQYYNNNTTPKKWVLHNFTDIKITNEYTGITNNAPSSTKKVTTVNMRYVNGDQNKREQHGGFRYPTDFGTLERINYVWDQVATPKTDKTQRKMVDYPDKGEAGTYDDVFLLVTVGKDDNGMYWQIDKLNTDGNSKATVLVPKTYDKRPDLHDKYYFVPDKMAMHFFKCWQPEDRNVWKDGDETVNDSKYKPAQEYDDNYISVFDVRVYKLLNPPDYADLINLKPGQTAQFDTANNTLTIDGKLRQELINPDSTFPQIRGGIPNNIRFFPNPGDNFDIKLSYRPTIL